MNQKTFRIFLVAFALFLIPLPSALAQEQPSIVNKLFDGYSESGAFINHNGRIDYYDYASGSAMPLCTRPECDHDAPSDEQLNYKNIPDLMQNTSLCYAWRLGQASALSGAVLYEGMIYFIDAFSDVFAEKNVIDVYASQVDGDTKLICSLGDRFSWDREVTVSGFLVYDDTMYLNLATHKNSLLDRERFAQLGKMTEEAMLFKISLKSGEIKELTHAEGQRCSYDLMGFQNDVLYYQFNIANDFTEREDAESLQAYKREYESKARYSILGIHAQTGEAVFPDERLREMTYAYGVDFEVIWKDRLYALILPQTEEETQAVFVVYNLTDGTCETEYSFVYDKETEFYPYYALSDEVMLSYDFGAGEYALRNLRTGELQLLDIPGTMFQNDGDAVWQNCYDLGAELFQTDPLIFYHYTADGEKVLAYIAAEDLLNSKTEIRDFISE